MPESDQEHTDALRASWAIQEDASSAGFDWPDITGVFNKVREELHEIESAWYTGRRDHARHELGDLLFAVVNLSRFLGADAGAELHRANARFERRFALLKEELKREGRAVEKCTLAELDLVWERVKKMTAPVSENKA